MHRSFAARHRAKLGKHFSGACSGRQKSEGIESVELSADPGYYAITFYFQDKTAVMSNPKQQLRQSREGA